MAAKKDTTALEDAPMKAMAQLQEAGLGNMVGLSTAWAEAMSDMGSEVISFVADRIKEDVKTQHEILHCKSVGDLQHIQSQFIQRVLDQYQTETGKLVEMGSQMFSTDAKGKSQ